MPWPGLCTEMLTYVKGTSTRTALIHNSGLHVDTMCNTGAMSNHIHDTVGRRDGSRRGASRRSSAPRTLTVLMGALRVSDIELGRRVGESRQTIHKKRTGQSAITADNIIDYAAALGVEPDVLMRRPSAALAWLVEHRAEQLDALEPVTGRQGELSKRSGRQGCTATTLTYLLYRDIVSAERTDLAA